MVALALAASSAELSAQRLSESDAEATIIAAIKYAESKYKADWNEHPVIALDRIESKTAALPIAASYGLGQKVAARTGMETKPFNELRVCGTDQAGRHICKWTSDTVITAQLMQINRFTASVLLSVFDPGGVWTIEMRLQRLDGNWEVSSSKLPVRLDTKSP
jgi:hypothetical protein